MLKIGITGGIGSGKSLVSKMFLQLGAAVYDADNAAKLLMASDQRLIAALKEKFGNDVYFDNGLLNRQKLSDLIFADDKNRQLINSMVHPAVAAHFSRWCNEQTAPYILKEAAILFESGAHIGLDNTLCIHAPAEQRITRVMERDNVSREKVISIINSQINDEERKAKCDYVITNDDATPLLPQVLKLQRVWSK